MISSEMVDPTTVTMQQFKNTRRIQHVSKTRCITTWTAQNTTKAKDITKLCSQVAKLIKYKTSTPTIIGIAISLIDEVEVLLLSNG
jgi:hypothetical protein